MKTMPCPFGTEYSYDSGQYYFCEVTGFDCTFEGFDTRSCINYLMERPQNRVPINEVLSENVHCQA